jgi:hypothetical protein
MLPRNLPRLSGAPRPTSRERAEPPATAREAHDRSTGASGRTALASLEAQIPSFDLKSGQLQVDGGSSVIHGRQVSRLGRLTTEALSVHSEGKLPRARASHDFAIRLTCLVAMLWRLPSDLLSNCPRVDAGFPEVDADSSGGSVFLRSEAPLTPFRVDLTPTRSSGDSEGSYGALLVIFNQDKAALTEDTSLLEVANLQVRG